MRIFEIVKENINLREAAELYGIDVNRYGKALCPFHNDRHPSLYVADDHYYCFACGEHGDVIDFVGRLFQLSPYNAAQKLIADFHLSPEKSVYFLASSRNCSTRAVSSAKADSLSSASATAVCSAFCSAS